MALRDRCTRPHGYIRYTHGCRCDTCRDAKAAYMAARRNAARVAGHVIPDGVTHGARSTFEEHGCRCDACVAAQAARGRLFLAEGVTAL